jgi:ribosomal protein S18 acetylase RimI-like enzyme
MPYPEIQFRPISFPEDLPFLSKVYASTRLEELAITGWPQEQIDQFLQMQFDMQHHYYQQQFEDAKYEIILWEKEEIGRLYTDLREDEIRIIDIVLLPQYRNKGIGRDLLVDILAKAASLGKCVRIHVEKNNPALKFYQSLGFCKIGDADVYLLMESQQ